MRRATPRVKTNGPGHLLEVPGGSPADQLVRLGPAAEQLQVVLHREAHRRAPGARGRRCRGRRRAAVGVGQRRSTGGRGRVVLVAVVAPGRLVREHRTMASVSTRMSTHWCDTAWLTPIGRPNCSRLLRGRPRARQRGVAQPDRVGRVEHAELCEGPFDDRRRAPRSPTTSASVHATSVNVTDAIGSGENVSCAAPVVTPGASAATATSEVPPSPRSALTRSTSAAAPKRTELGADSVQPAAAVVAVSGGGACSDRAPGSSKASAPTASPPVRGPSQRGLVPDTSPDQSSGSVVAYDDSNGDVTAPRPSSSARMASSSRP